MRATAEIEEDAKGGQRILVSELPYQTSVEAIGAKIDELVNERRIEGIRDVTDLSAGDTVGLVIDLKRDANAQVVLNQLYKHTPMQTNFAANHGRARRRRAADCSTCARRSRCTSAHQVEVITRRSQYRLNKARDRAHILEGLLKALDMIDAIITLIRGSESADAARQALQLAPYEFSETQATHILDMALRRLAALERQKLRDEYDELAQTIAELEAILADDVKLRGVIKDELTAIQDKYGDERRTRDHDRPRRPRRPRPHRGRGARAHADAPGLREDGLRRPVPHAGPRRQGRARRQPPRRGLGRAPAHHDRALVPVVLLEPRPRLPACARTRSR